MLMIFIYVNNSKLSAFLQSPANIQNGIWQRFSWIFYRIPVKLYIQAERTVKMQRAFLQKKKLRKYRSKTLKST